MKCITPHSGSSVLQQSLCHETKIWLKKWWQKRKIQSKIIKIGSNTYQRPVKDQRSKINNKCLDRSILRRAAPSSSSPSRHQIGPREEENEQIRPAFVDF